MPSAWSFESDIQSIVDDIGFEWEQLAHANIFITGGTGFIGKWLLETLLAANHDLKLDLCITVLSRDPENFFSEAPKFATLPEFKFIKGEVENFRFPEGDYTHLIHAATDASAKLNENNPLKMFEVIVSGTRRVLDFCLEKKIKRCLFLSSGAVYGAQPWDLLNTPEEWSGAPDCLNAVNAYGEAKRAAEMLCAIYAKQFGLEISIARIFALLGPYLPLDAHFAAGNFISNALKKEKIIIKGNGRPIRSYLYPTDLCVMLMTLLLRGPSGRAYNVGSPEGISIADLAETVSRVLGGEGFEILSKDQTGWNAGRYTPDVSRIKTDFGLSPKISLEESILRTALWNGWRP
jgi:dTDP-glucose 4,6-dehydratase